MTSPSRIHIAVVLVGVVFLPGGCGKSGPVPSSKLRDSAPKATSTKAQASAQTKPVVPAQGAVPNLKIVQKSLAFQWIEKNKPSLKATAREFQGDEISRKGILLDFRGELYDNGKLTTTMTAPKVVVDAEKRTVTATGGVLIKSLVRRTVVRSEWAVWYSRQNKIVGDGGVRWTSEMNGKGRFEGQSAAFEADTALKTITALSSAKGLLPQ
ncbi:MAG: LPS export ABC transporter periplasmic protein LptC [Armatimonadetes bacterium]|nr:LPS export ABC transporter periplasmic protein LptC [Armatimonadota bacterium]